MSTDAIHAIALLSSVASLCGGAWLIGGSGAALITFGCLLLVGVVYARTISIQLMKRKADYADDTN